MPILDTIQGLADKMTIRCNRIASTMFTSTGISFLKLVDDNFWIIQGKNEPYYNADYTLVDENAPKYALELEKFGEWTIENRDAYYDALKY